jgi:hypothetical protein
MKGMDINRTNERVNVNMNYRLIGFAQDCPASRKRELFINEKVINETVIKKSMRSGNLIKTPKTGIKIYKKYISGLSNVLKPKEDSDIEEEVVDEKAPANPLEGNKKSKSNKENVNNKENAKKNDFFCSILKCF